MHYTLQPSWIVVHLQVSADLDLQVQIIYVASKVFLELREIEVTHGFWRAVPSNTAHLLCVVGKVATQRLLLWCQTAGIIHLCLLWLDAGL